MKLPTIPFFSARVISLARWIVTLIPLAFFAWLLNQNYIVGSSVTYTYKPGTWSQLIIPDKPRDVVASVESKNSMRWRIGADELRFSSYIPRQVDRIRVRVGLSDVTQPILVSKAVGPADSRQLQNTERFAFLDQLVWPSIHEGGLTLWQRPGREKIVEGKIESEPVHQFSTIQDFLAHPPDALTVGVYGVDEQSFFRPQNYQPHQDLRSVGHALRGGHSAYLYIEREPLTLHVDKIDLNREVGADPLTISIYTASQPISSQRKFVYRKKFSDDGNSSEDGQQGKSQTIDIRLNDLPPGIYTVTLNASPDVLLKNFSTTSQYLAFQKQLYLADGPEYGLPVQPVRLRTDGRTVEVKAMHAPGLQIISAGKERIRLKELKEGEKIIPGPDHILSFAIGDVTVTGPGPISFEGWLPWPEQSARKVDLVFEPNVEKMNYILAAYQPHSAASNLVLDQTFALSDLTIVKKRATFILTLPGLTNGQYNVGLQSIRVTLLRDEPGWKKALKKIL